MLLHIRLFPISALMRIQNLLNWFATINRPWTTSVHLFLIFPSAFSSCSLDILSHFSWESPQQRLQHVCKGAYGWLLQGLLDWFVAPTTALYHPTVCFSHCVFLLYILFFNSFALLTWQSVQREAAGGEYLHKYWTKTGRNSRTATGLILDKYFTRPTNTPGGGGGVWGAWRMRRILANTHWGGM